MFQGLNIDVKLSAGRWLINDKQYINYSHTEQTFFDEFIKHMNYGNIERVR